MLDDYFSIHKYFLPRLSCTRDWCHRMVSSRQVAIYLFCMLRLTWCDRSSRDPSSQHFLDVANESDYIWNGCSRCAHLEYCALKLQTDPCNLLRNFFFNTSHFKYVVHVWEILVTLACSCPFFILSSPTSSNSDTADPRTNGILFIRIIQLFLLFVLKKEHKLSWNWMLYNGVKILSPQ